MLINKANEPITQALVLICEQTIELNDVQITKGVNSYYEVTSDSHYDITVEFQSGKKIHKATGYVTNGLNYHHEIMITDTDIEIIGGVIEGRGGHSVKF